jgi:hypothetical protein
MPIRNKADGAADAPPNRNEFAGQNDPPPPKALVDRPGAGEPVDVLFKKFEARMLKSFGDMMVRVEEDLRAKQVEWEKTRSESEKAAADKAAADKAAADKNAADKNAAATRTAEQIAEPRTDDHPASNGKNRSDPTPADRDVLAKRVFNTFANIVDDLQPAIKAKADSWAERIYPDRKKDKPDEETKKPPPIPANSIADYSATATEIALILYASPELRRGVAPFMSLVPGLLSVADNGVKDDAWKKSTLPGAIGVASTLVNSRLLR